MIKKRVQIQARVIYSRLLNARPEEFAVLEPGWKKKKIMNYINDGIISENRRSGAEEKRYGNPRETLGPKKKKKNTQKIGPGFGVERVGANVLNRTDFQTLPNDIRTIFFSFVNRLTTEFSPSWLLNIFYRTELRFYVFRFE